MFCPSCGVENTDDQDFCMSCGTVLPRSKGHVAQTIAPPRPSTPPNPSAQIGAGPQTQPMDQSMAGGVSASTTQSSSIHEALQTGATYAGRYQILGQLGRGGMGMVYRAKDLELGGEELAIKVLQAQFMESPQEVERFKREIITARRITHAHVIRIHDFGFSGQEAYISMELLTGGALSDKIARREIDIASGVQIAMQIADGLAAAHDEGIIHRDIKPHNVMFDDKGRVKLLDFGIARLSAVTSHTVGFTGTPHYMSPEQAEGREVTTRSDIYALGVLMFEIFTHTLPFQADSLVRLAVMHAQEPPPPPRSINPEIPEPIEQIILTALRKDPEQRYQHASQIVSDLRAFMEGRPIQYANAPRQLPPGTIAPSSNTAAPLAGRQTQPPVTPAKAPGEARRGGGAGMAVAVVLGVVLLAAVAAVLYQFVGPGFGGGKEIAQATTPPVAETPTAAETVTVTVVETATPRRTRNRVRDTPKPTPTAIQRTVRPTPKPSVVATAAATPKPTPKGRPIPEGQTRFQFVVLKASTKKPVPGVRVRFCGQHVKAPKGFVNTTVKLDDKFIYNGCEIQVYQGTGASSVRLDRAGEYRIQPKRNELVRMKLVVD